MYIRSLFLKLNFKTNTNHDHFNFLFLISQPQHILVFFTNFSFALIKFVITVTRTRWLTPFVPNTTFLYSLKTVILENRNIFCFQGVEKGCTGNKCVNFLTFFRQDHTITLQPLDKIIAITEDMQSHSIENFTHMNSNLSKCNKI